MGIDDISLHEFNENYAAGIREKFGDAVDATFSKLNGYPPSMLDTLDDPNRVLVDRVTEFYADGQKVFLIELTIAFQDVEHLIFFNANLNENTAPAMALLLAYCQQEPFTSGEECALWDTGVYDRWQTRPVS